MNEIDKWNEINFLLSDNIKTDISENDFEKNVIQALRVLGWKEYSGDFDIRPSFQFGASNRIMPDFVIKSDTNQKLFVIEIKQPSIPLTSTFQQQLFSYMRHLKLEYGILIGQSIQIFYDGNLAKQEDPILLETIKFEKNNKKGETFVELFNKENYNVESLKNFTIEALKKINQKQDFKELTNKIISEKYTEKLTELIKQDFISEYDGELIDSVLKELKFEIIEKSSNIIRETEIKTFSKPRESNFSSAVEKKISSSLSQGKRTVNGMKIGQFVQHSFRKASEQNLISESEINNLQNPDYSKRTFKANFEILKNQNRDIKDEYGRPRYYTPEIFCGNYHLTSQWVSTQWDLLLDWLNKIGYNYK